LFCRLEDVRVHSYGAGSFHVARTIVEEQSPVRLAAQSVETDAVDGRVRLDDAVITRPDLNIEFVQPFECSAQLL
jgi:hypothetical protein